MALAATSLGASTTGQTASASSVAMTGGVDIIAGDTVVVYVAHGSVNTDSTSSVSDGTNTYTRVTNTNVGGDGSTINGYGSLYWKDNCSGVVNPTITATLTTGRIDRFIAAIRITGANTGGSGDIGASANTGSTASPSQATGTLAQADEIIIGALWANNNPTITEDSNFTNTSKVLLTDNNKTGNLAYRIVSSTTTSNYAPSRGGSASGNLIHVASFKMASAASNGNFFQFFS